MRSGRDQLEEALGLLRDAGCRLRGGGGRRKSLQPVDADTAAAAAAGRLLLAIHRVNLTRRIYDLFGSHPVYDVVRQPV